MKVITPIFHYPRNDDFAMYEVRINAELEMKRISKFLKKITDVDFAILINTDIPFRVDYERQWKKPFSDFLKESIDMQKSMYWMFLRNIMYFPDVTFQRN